MGRGGGGGGGGRKERKKERKKVERVEERGVCVGGPSGGCVWFHECGMVAR